MIHVIYLISDLKAQNLDYFLRSLHAESEIFVRIFRTLKNKYDLTLCQSRLHTASETFVCHKKKLDQVWFSAFMHP